MNDLMTQDISQAVGVMLNFEQAECPVIHKFEPGHYIRELHMKAGTMAIGRYQKFDHVNVFVKGKVKMLNDDGTTKILTAPMTFVSPPGQKIGLVLEDVIWQNVYQTDIQDVELLDAHYFAADETFIQHSAHRFAQESVLREVDRIDYLEALKELNVTEEEVSQQSNIIEDQMPLPKDIYNVTLGISPIHGMGIFASNNIEMGETIGPARLGYYRTPLGRYTNHAKTPNAAMMRTKGGDFYLVAIADIQGAVGGYQGTEITIDYREARKQVLLENTICQA